LFTWRTPRLIVVLPVVVLLAQYARRDRFGAGGAKHSARAFLPAHEQGIARRALCKSENEEKDA